MGSDHLAATTWHDCTTASPKKESKNKRFLPPKNLPFPNQPVAHSFCLLSTTTSNPHIAWWNKMSGHGATAPGISVTECIADCQQYGKGFCHGLQYFTRVGSFHKTSAEGVKGSMLHRCADCSVSWRFQTLRIGEFVVTSTAMMIVEHESRSVNTSAPFTTELG